MLHSYNMGFPGSSVGKESACNAGDPGSIPGLGWSPGEGIGYPLQYSWASLVAQLVKNPLAMRENPGSIPGSGRSPGGGHGNPLQYSCPENPHGQRSLVGYSPWGHKESDTTGQPSLSRLLSVYSCHLFLISSAIIRFSPFLFLIVLIFAWYVPLCLVAQSCPTLYDPMDCSLPGSFVHGIFQAIVLEWIAISFISLLYFLYNSY